ncbi:hypothetical protein SDC9_207027 [bioreactor metagenome]|uniref:Uncharacterized protein n=1 Tax=bioreactor metagenome TaxID=1076179 RepID=A0A645J799_9ZZZZ
MILEVSVDGHREQWILILELALALLDTFWVELPVLGLADEIGVDRNDRIIPLQPGAAIQGIEIRFYVAIFDFGMAAQIGGTDFLDHAASFGFIDDIEAFTDAGYFRTFTDDIVGQPVQGTYAVTDVGQ